MISAQHRVRLLLRGFVFIALAVAATFLSRQENAMAAHEFTVCDGGISDGVDSSYNPDIYLVVAFTKCHPPSFDPDPPDVLAIAVFWDWYDWQGSQWQL